MKNKQLIMMLGAAIFLGIIVFGPALSNLQKVIRINKQQKTELSSLEKKLQILEGIDNNLITDRVKKMEAVFPSDKPIVQLLSSLAQLAAKHNLSFGGVSLSPGSLTDEKKEDSLADLTFGFEVGGELNSILKFLQELERVAPLMKIDKVGLTIKTLPIIAAKINVSAFYQPAPKSLGTISQPVKLLSRSEEAILSQLFNFTQFQAVLPSVQTGKTNLFDFGQ
ncbi:type 4a pilus biogenesis protein PilO [Patescibacteria group bacterium]|nr:type 4a pilus biogenesis protein PilO [Patescibacteria group bacterium]